MKKIVVALIVTLCLSLVLISPAVAGEKQPPSENNLPAVGIESLQLLAFEDCSIVNIGNNRVAIDGSTTAQFVVDSVGVKLYLQQWNGSNWIDINSSGVFVDYISDYVEGYIQFTIQPGYYYRAKGLHTANDGSISEQQYSYSGYIWID